MGNTTGRQRSDHDGHDGHDKGAWQRFDDGDRATNRMTEIRWREIGPRRQNSGVWTIVIVSPVVVSAIFVFPSHKKQCVY